MLVGVAMGRLGTMCMPMYRDPHSTAQTAVAYRSCAKILFSASSNYEMCVLENITALGQKDQGGISDTEYIVNDFKVHGWTAVAEDMDARDYGSPSVRLRTIFIALKGTSKSVVEKIALEIVFV